MVKLDLTNSEAFSLHLGLQVLLNQFPTIDIDGKIHDIDEFISVALIKELKSDA